jgi:hypothetical protein
VKIRIPQLLLDGLFGKQRRIYPKHTSCKNAQNFQKMTQM